MVKDMTIRNNIYAEHTHSRWDEEFFADFLPLSDKTVVPTKAKPDDSGFDVHAIVEDNMGNDYILVLHPGQRSVIPLGFALAINPGFEAQVRPRSGTAAKAGITILNSPGTIDSAYRGPCGAILINHGQHPIEIKTGDRIAQIVFCWVPRMTLRVVSSLNETDRGTGGFGSTGV